VSDPSRCIIIGAGPAGLTAAYELTKLGTPAVIFERDGVVGGIARTVCHDGYRFDVGGHRFFTKVKTVQAIWEEILGEDFLRRPRLSRIYYNDHFFDYPLKPLNALKGLGPFESARIALSYARAALFPSPEERTFEQWVSNRFGRRLYEIFFKTYTEKVWGIPCSEIGAEWAAQRIKNLDLVSALKNALLGSAPKDARVIG
jgi:protoporphyrinogen oxidase